MTIQPNICDQEAFCLFFFRINVLFLFMVVVFIVVDLTLLRRFIYSLFQQPISGWYIKSCGLILLFQIALTALQKCMQLQHRQINVVSFVWPGWSMQALNFPLVNSPLLASIANEMTAKHLVYLQQSANSSRFLKQPTDGTVCCYDTSPADWCCLDGAWLQRYTAILKSCNYL